VRAAVKLAKPSWATRIEKLRGRLSLSQTEFANRLGVSAMAVSRWERGINEPPAKCYVMIGKLAGSEECWFFWERIGLSKRDVSRMM
jgi:DNA-binding XRE family transcriptional regulator